VFPIAITPVAHEDVFSLKLFRTTNMRISAIPSLTQEMPRVQLKLADSSFEMRMKSPGNMLDPEIAHHFSHRLTFGYRGL
jgi:hypothetical protein